MRSNRYLLFALLGAFFLHIVLFISLSLLNHPSSFNSSSYRVFNLQHIATTPATLAQKPQKQATTQANRQVKNTTKPVDKVIINTTSPSLLKNPNLATVELVEAISLPSQTTKTTIFNNNITITPSDDSLATTNEILITEPIFDANFLHNPKPAYPYFSRQRQQQGTVLLRVKVSIEGKAEAIELNKSSGFKLLDEVAQNTVKTWRFVPAKRGNNAVSAWVIVPITFELS